MKPNIKSDMSAIPVIPATLAKITRPTPILQNHVRKVSIGGGIGPLRGCGIDILAAEIDFIFFVFLQIKNF